MKKLALGIAALSPLALLAGPGVYGDAPDAKHAWAVHDWNRPKPVKVEPAAQLGNAPSDAVVLFDGTRASFEKNWCDKDGNPSKWAYSSEGYFSVLPGRKNGGNIFTRAQFADCQLHIEYRHPADTTSIGGSPQMRGNSGVFFMGLSGHEVQILESYYTSREMEGRDGFVDNYADGQAGSVYAENPPMVNPARKSGEWQVYDIVFHKPVWEGSNLKHPGSITVFFNGVLVQDHWEMEGISTHCRRKPLVPPASPVGPLSLQDHGCKVDFRNVWYRPLPSRWDNKTHSAMSADTDEVMKLRRATAATLFAKIANPNEVSLANMKNLAEVISYTKEGVYGDTWRKVATGFHAKLDAADDAWLKVNKTDLLALRRMLDTLIKAGIVDQQCGTRKRISAIALRLGWEK